MPIQEFTRVIRDPRSQTVKKEEIRDVDSISKISKIFTMSYNERTAVSIRPHSNYLNLLCALLKNKNRLHVLNAFTK